MIIIQNLGLILLAAISILALPKSLKKLYPYIGALVLGYCFITFYYQSNIAFPKIYNYRWSELIGFHFQLSFNGISSIFSLLICGIGVGVFIYCSEYMKDKNNLKSFYSTLLIFSGAMLGLVMSNNLILTFVFWELTSLCSFLLIAHKTKDSQSLESARCALFITILGGFALLVSFLLLALDATSLGLNWEQALTVSELLKLDPRELKNINLVMIFLFVAVATKSAQFPFYFWLPGAMSGPTPVSSFLHSATMVKAGIFLLMKFYVLMSPIQLWFWILVPMGLITMLVSSFIATAQRDIKKILAYSTISALGTLVMLLGLGSSKAVQAAVVYFVAHAFYKAALFQTVGNIDFASGSRDFRNLAKLGNHIPLVALTAVLASLSMAGAPPLFGFFGKELAYMAKVQLGDMGIVIMALAVLANILIVALALSICLKPFFINKLNETPLVKLKKVPISMMMPPLLMSFIGLMIGIFPGYFDTTFGQKMASAIAGKDILMDLKLWHGLENDALVVLIASIITLGCGIWVFFKIRKIQDSFIIFLESKRSFNLLAIYNRVLKLLQNIAIKISHITQNSHLRNYLAITFLGTLILFLNPVSSLLLTPLNFSGGWMEVLFVTLILGSSLCLLKKNSNPRRVVWLSLSGLGIVLLYAYFSALDLSMTQLMIETLSILFIFLLLMKLSSKQVEKNVHLSIKIMIFMIALVPGLFLMLKKSSPSLDLSYYFIENSLSQAFGRNIVNVILVDFRAMDTMGEAIVVAIAALGVGALMKKSKKEKTGLNDE